MIWFLPLLAYGKIITKQLYSGPPVYIGRFWGENVGYRIICKLESDKVRSNARFDLQILASEKLLVNPNCNDFNGITIELSSPSHGSWSSDDQGNITIKAMNYFYLADCKKSLPNHTPIKVELTLKDSVTKFYSYDVSNLGYIYFFTCLNKLIIIILCIYEIYKERVEDIPITFIFILSALFLLASVFNSLYYSIYGIDGESYKFILVFSSFFSTFSEVSIIGILILLAADKFSPKDFSIGDKDFYVYIGIFSFELIISIVNIIRSESLEFFDIFGRTEGILWALERGYLLVLYIRYLKNKSFIKLVGFKNVKIIGGIYIILPLLLCLSWWGFYYYFYEGRYSFITQFSTDAVLIFLYKQFSSSNLAGLLPLKTHSF
ncbi:hypothetical protein SteCoe_24532 [Stentor coeruleus]|uniref:Uncharacterized protein n=1 Tax=Stentor coeruleus TaxID=5963 RepID=A0A1R2BHD0_9CILI|nr:hypothetical protein SteCoe_24532 [Stentor coeruleus]